MDSNILIDHLNGFKRATVEIRNYSDRAVSVVTWIEVMTGLPEKATFAAESLLSNFQILPLSEAIAQETIFVRKTTRLKLPNAIILATAHVEQRTLLTRNTRDFKPGRFVRIPYELS